jgi:hypothetical protein
LIFNTYLSVKIKIDCLKSSKYVCPSRGLEI